MTPRRQQPAEPGPRGGVGEGDKSSPLGKIFDFFKDFGFCLDIKEQRHLNDLRPEASADLVMYCYRLIAGEDHQTVVSSAKQYVTDRSILSSLEATAPELLLVLARLMLFVRLCVKAPSFYFTLLIFPASSKLSWIFQITRDLN